MAQKLHADYVIIGGGIAGVSCMNTLQELAPDQNIILISSTPYIKVASNVRKIGKIMEDFKVFQKHYEDFIFSNVKFILSNVTCVNTKDSYLFTSNGQIIEYKKLCICTGAKPNLISKHPNIIGLRDMDSISTFQDLLQSAKRFVLIGNGGIAIELVNEISNCEIIWVIKHDAIGNTFFDSVAAKFFTPHLQNKPSKPKTIKYAIKSHTATNELGNALGPDWHLDLILSGKENHSNIILEIQTEVSNIYTHDEFKTHSSNEESNLHQWPVFVELTNGKTYGGDFILSATGVLPNTEVFRANNDFKVSQDGGLLVDEYMRTNLPNVYAAGDACTANWNIEKHWFQMKLWTQARQMGSYAGHCMHADLHNEIIFPDISFELFTHVTSFFGFKVILLGLFNGQKIDNNYEVLMRITENAEYIKVVLQDGKVQGAILVGDTDLEETFENLILSQLNISGLEEDILNPDIDIEDYFD